MIEFLAFLIVFWFIFNLRKQVEMLQKQLFNLSKTQQPVLVEEVEEVPAVLQKEQKVEKVEYAQKSVNTTFIKKEIPTKTYPSLEPNIVDKVISIVKSYFSEGNIVVRIGGVILFFGLAFLSKYAAEHSVISIEIRLIGIALVSIVLIVVGWRFRGRKDYYGIILQGIGVAILYLLVFASAKFYILFPLSFAFMVMFLIVIFGSMLAVVQNALPLAIFAVGGGFIAPILTSDGTGSHIMLFGYFALLNSGIVGIAWYRSWRVLNLTGFFFTFFIATAWGVLKYDSALFISTEPFLLIFFIFYLAVSILFTLKQTFEPRGIVDATLVFGLPLVVFSLQGSLVHEMEYALAYSAIAMGTLYFILFKVLSRFSKMHLLSEAFLALSVIFYTIAIPNIFDNDLTGALWALESSAIIWISLRQKRVYARMFGELLQVIAIVLYVTSSHSQHMEMAFINTSYLGYIIVILSAFVSSYLLRMNKSQLNNFDKDSSTIFLGSAIGLLLFSGFKEATRMDFQMGNVMLIYIAISSSILATVASRLKWDELVEILQNYLFVGMLLFISLFTHYTQYHPFEGLGSIAIILFFGVHYALLYFFEGKWNQQMTLHVIGLWIMTLIGAAELGYGISSFTHNAIFEVAGWGMFLIVIAGLIMRADKFLPLVFDKYKQSYRVLGVGGIVLILLIWELYSFRLNANPTPLPYIPFLNPLELAQLLGFVIFYNWIRIEENNFFQENSNLVYTIGGFIVFVFSTVVLARSMHFYIDVNYEVYALSRSIIFQMALSVMWGVMAMAVMLTSKYLQNRTVWIAGASLMGIVVLKLFLVELSRSGTIERIISFIVVGILLLLIGYFAPLPSLKKEIVK